METLRASLLSLLILLQALAPYLHSHAAPTPDAGLHLHLAASAAPSADGAAASARQPPSADEGRTALQPRAPDFAPPGPAPAHQALLDAAGLDDRVSVMPTEWLRDQPLLAHFELGSLPPRAPPAAAAHAPCHPRAGSRPASPRFSVMAYPAIAPPRPSSFA
jgi:hypothetical protein